MTDAKKRLAKGLKMNATIKTEKPVKNDRDGGHSLRLLVGPFLPIARIHHIEYSYGWMLRGVRLCYFPQYARLLPSYSGWKRLEKGDTFHDCTATGIY